jgi:hypothetical protein
MSNSSLNGIYRGSVEGEDVDIGGLQEGGDATFLRPWCYLAIGRS